MKKGGVLSHPPSLPNVTGCCQWPVDAGAVAADLANVAFSATVLLQQPRTEGQIRPLENFWLGMHATSSQPQHRVP